MDKLYTIQEVAEKIDRSVYTIGRWQKEGYVTPTYKPKPGGGLIRQFTEQDIEILEGVKQEKIKIMISGIGKGSQ